MFWPKTPLTGIGLGLRLIFGKQNFPVFSSVFFLCPPLFFFLFRSLSLSHFLSFFSLSSSLPVSVFVTAQAQGNGGSSQLQIVAAGVLW